MFRWPVDFAALSVAGGGFPRSATLEITPRGALFTLAALSHVGHPAHLALIDAYLKGQVRVTSTAPGIGEDSRVVAASLAVPLLAAFELGVERLTLADVVLLPRDELPASSLDCALNGEPIFTPDSPRLLMRAHGVWHRVRSAEHFEAPGCLGTTAVGRADPWHHAVAELRPDGRLAAEVREPSSRDEALDNVLAHQLRSDSLARFAHEAARTEPDGHRTTVLLPPPNTDPDRSFGMMRDKAWETIEEMTGRPLPERRTEPIALRLVGDDGRTTTLEIGVSVVIGRNQTVFAAWVGSDGRAMIRLLPPGGMTAR